MTLATKRSPWLVLMVVTGFCSMIYELALAQLLTGLLGNAMARFATTVGVYIVGLGLGSLSFRDRGLKANGRLFFQAETLLFVLGSLSPLLFVGSYRVATALTTDANFQTNIILVVTHAVIFGTGFLSGFELPALSAIAHGSSVEGDSHVLSADYLGMFLASLLFPFILYPVLGLIAAIAIATALNLVAAVVTYFLIQGRSKSVFALLLLFSIINVSVFIFAPNIQTWLSLLYAPPT